MFPTPNILTLTDSYKPSHWKQYPPYVTGVFSFFESRGGKFPATTFFGLQYYLKRYLSGRVVTESAIKDAKAYFAAHYGNAAIFNEAGWRYILERHNGQLPVEIRAVPEGTTVPVSNALMTIQNTDIALPWLTNYLETLLSEVWYPTTVATHSRAMRARITRELVLTGEPKLIDFKLHDFGFRGSTSPESAGIGGAAHLVNFKGTDTLAAIDLVRDYYGEKMAGFSIPAAEHSTISSWGREGEAEAYENMLNQFPTGLVAVVSDTWDVFNACREIWGKKLREKVLARDGILVVRPDSGYPPKVVVSVLDILGEAFGSIVNEKGFKVLDPHVRVIQGDGIDDEMLDLVLREMTKARWSTDNIAFGSGGGLLQKVNRDTNKFALKASAVFDRGEWRGVSKDPVTDPGKRSKAGRLKLVKERGIFRTVREEDSDLPNELVPVFRNGLILSNYSFSEIRERALED